MANINNLRIGDVTPNSLMLDKPYQPISNQFTSFGSIVSKDNTNTTVSPNFAQWEINDDCEVEIISPRKIRIKKFKIDTWIIRIKTGNIDNPSDWAKLRIKVDGLTYLHNNIICHTAGSDTPDGFTNAYLGTVGWNVLWYPGHDTSGNYAKGLLIQGCMNYNDNATYNDGSLYMGRAPWDIGSYSFISDGEVSTKALYGIGCKAICIGLFGGVQNAASYLDDSNGAYKVYDISDHPLTIDLDVADSSVAVDYSSVEIWDAYIGDTQVYHKDKTVENCLEKYKYCKYISSDSDDEDSQYQIAKDSSMTANNIIVPIPIDFDSLFGKQTSFNIAASNSEFWDAVKENAQNIGLIIRNSDYNKLKGVFQDSNISGAITIKLLNPGNIAGDRMFENTLLNEINFTYDSNIVGDAKNQFTSINTLFKSTPNLKTITSTKDLLARDMSGCFEYSGIEEIPGIILYSARTYNEVKGANPYCSLTSYFCDGCSKLTIINRYRGATNREDSSNIIKFQSAYYSFNNCSQLVTIDPILDFEFVRPSTSENAFKNCGKLTDVRIRNLNHGDWHLDDNSQHGNLSALNQESIEYLFANLKDLTTRNPDLVYSGGNPGDDNWNGNQFAANPDVSSANLYCPSSWESYITSEMITAANAKGWTVYIGGEPARQPQDYLIDAWIFSGHTNEEAPAQITGEKDTALKCYNFAWNEEGSGFKDGYLCFDGVGDYLGNNLLFKEPLIDFTVICRREILKYKQWSIFARDMGQYGNSTSAFYFGYLDLPTYPTPHEGVLSFGNVNILDIDIAERVSYMTPTSYNGTAISRGAKNSECNGLVISPTGGVACKIGYFALYSKTLANEQIQAEINRLDALWESRKQ